MTSMMPICVCPRSHRRTATQNKCSVSTHFSINKAAKTSPKSLNTPTMQVPASSMPREVIPAACVGHITVSTVVSATRSPLHRAQLASYMIGFYPSLCFHAFCLPIFSWNQAGSSPSIVRWVDGVNHKLIIMQKSTRYHLTRAIYLYPTQHATFNYRCRSHEKHGSPLSRLSQVYNTRTTIATPPPRPRPPAPPPTSSTCGE